MAAKDANEFLKRVVDLASLGGWYVVDYHAEMPGSITLVDVSGTTVEIVDRNYGLDISYYVERLPAARARSDR